MRRELRELAFTCAVHDEGIQKFVMSTHVVGYFSDLIEFVRQQSFNLDGLVAEAAKYRTFSTLLLFAHRLFGFGEVLVANDEFKIFEWLLKATC